MRDTTDYYNLFPATLKNGNLFYEGEYLDGKRNGKGKEYELDGQLFFEGYYAKGERNGKGKEYDNGELIYEGKYYKGRRKE